MFTVPCAVAAVSAAVAALLAKCLFLMIMKCNKIPNSNCTFAASNFLTKCKKIMQCGRYKAQKEEKRRKKWHPKTNKKQSKCKKKMFTLFFFFFHSAIFNAKVITLWGNSWFLHTENEEEEEKNYAVSFYCSRTVTSVNVLWNENNIVVSKRSEYIHTCMYMYVCVFMLCMCVWVFPCACMYVRTMTVISMMLFLWPYSFILQHLHMFRGCKPSVRFTLYCSNFWQ